MLQPSPLETLASYAIAFVAGVLAALCVMAYGRFERTRSPRSVR